MGLHFGITKKNEHISKFRKIVFRIGTNLQYVLLLYRTVYLIECIVHIENHLNGCSVK